MSGEEGGRGWGAVAGLSLAAAALSVVHPALLVFVPLALFLLALPPRRPQLVALALVFLAIAFARSAGADPLWYTERGWVLIVAAWFVLLVVALPRATFMPRALAAVGAAAISAAAIFLANRGGWTRLDLAVAQRLELSAEEATGFWGGLAGQGFASQLSGSVARVAELQALLYPALLGLATVAALGVAWWGYNRLSGDDARVLSPLRDFRFPDALVWVLIAGGMLVLLPAGEVALRTGSNLLVFMGALYALRGAAVMLALAGSPGLLGALVGVVAVVLLYPLVMAAALVVGLSDTWLDLRSRRKAAAPGN